MNKSIKSTILLAVTTLCIGYSANAQIKVVGDDYQDTLSGVKNTYAPDIDFNSLFPKVNPREYLGYLSERIPTNCNIIGDTVFLVKDKKLVLKYGNPSGFAVMSNGNEEQLIDVAPAGYYTVTGYVFGEENATALLANYFDEKAIKDYFFGIGYNYETKEVKKLKEAIIKNQISEKNLNEWIFFIKLTSVNDNGNKIDFYVPSTKVQSGFFNTENLMQVRFYQEFRNHFIGKKVARITDKKPYSRKDQRSPIFDFSSWFVFSGKNDVIKDALAEGDIVKLQDSIFTVVDVVVKEHERQNKIPRMYCILQGENTGKFALEISELRHDYYVPIDIGNSFFMDCFELPYATYCEYKKNKSRSTDGVIVCIDDLEGIKKVANDSVKIQKMNMQQRKNAEMKREQEFQRLMAQEKAAFKQKMIALYGTKYGELVGNNQVSIGMTKEMCRDAWGSPMNNYRTTTRFGQSEVWCYNYKTRVYFYDGKVVQIDD